MHAETEGDILKNIIFLSLPEHVPNHFSADVVIFTAESHYTVAYGVQTFTNFKMCEHIYSKTMRDLLESCHANISLF